MHNTPQPTAEVKPRGKPSDEGRFVWQSALTLERILNELGHNQAAYGVAVYVALCRLSAKDKNNPTIQATVSKVSGMARISYRKTFEVLHALANIKVIAIESGQREKGVFQQPSTYTLLATRLHNRKSDRLHNTQSADCIRRTTSRAENPIETPYKGVNKENNSSPGGSASPVKGSAAPAGVLKEGNPFTDVGDWGKP